MDGVRLANGEKCTKKLPEHVSGSLSPKLWRDTVVSIIMIFFTVVLDEDKKVHCGPNKTVLTRKSSDDRCCGNVLFNNKTECCCDTENGLKIHPINADCCPEQSGASEHYPLLIR